MNFSRFSALILAAALVASSAVGCSGETKSSSSSRSTTLPTVEGVTVFNVAVSEEKEVNDTGFSLNKVIDAGIQTAENEHFYYLDVTIKNPTDTDYELSTLNNFYAVLSTGEELTGNVRTQLYATTTFSDRYAGSPFVVSAKSEFSNVIGGFLIPDGAVVKQICFFPTKNDDNDKSNVIKVDINASDIISVPDDLKR